MNPLERALKEVNEIELTAPRIARTPYRSGLIKISEAKRIIRKLAKELKKEAVNCAGKDFDFGSDELTCTNPDCQDKGACARSTKLSRQS